MAHRGSLVYIYIRYCAKYKLSSSESDLLLIFLGRMCVYLVSSPYVNRRHIHKWCPRGECAHTNCTRSDFHKPCSEVEKRKGQSREKYQPYATSFVSHIVNWCMFSTALRNKRTLVLKKAKHLVHFICKNDCPVFISTGTRKKRTAHFS
jgi:hypothetical protein